MAEMAPESKHSYNDIFCILANFVEENLNFVWGLNSRLGQGLFEFMIYEVSHWIVLHRNGSESTAGYKTFSPWSVYNVYYTCPLNHNMHFLKERN